MRTGSGISAKSALILSALWAIPNAWAEFPGPGTEIIGVSRPRAFDVYQEIFDSVTQSQMVHLLSQLSGGESVTVAGETFSIHERYTPKGKAKFRKFWKSYFQALGMQVNELDYITQHNIGEANGHNLEAILPGQSPDSVVIIVHYDSIGPLGHESENPGVDDDMSGMAVSLETARLLKSYAAKLRYTVRFVASDYEEHASPGLEGARHYARYIQSLAKTNGFKLVAAIDNEQIGWNCAKSEGGCSDGASHPTFDIYSCSGNSRQYDSKALGDLLEEIARKYSTLHTTRSCMSSHSDHYAMWEIGVPAVVYSEHTPFDNPHFDRKGDDTLDKIDQAYFSQIAAVGVTFAASVVGIDP